MIPKTKTGLLKTGKIKNVVRSLTVLDVDISKLDQWLPKTRPVRLAGRHSVLRHRHQLLHY